MNFRIKSGMIKTTIREIKASLGRYLAIFAIVMLGVGFFAGLKATKPAMIATVDDYLRRQDFFDFKLLSAIGFDKEDTKELFGTPAAKTIKALKIMLIVPTLLPVCFLIVKPKISKPPVEIPFFKAKPVPKPLIAAPKRAQIIGSCVSVIG